MYMIQTRRDMEVTGHVRRYITVFTIQSSRYPSAWVRKKYIYTDMYVHVEKIVATASDQKIRYTIIY